ncbi:MAG: PIN domain-containing protein, partial [Methylobacteriaceae bacterium]|nr:PIN domain-containing protein [Methylobacteriaceae bacterium]
MEFGLESMSAGRRHDLRRAAFGRLLEEILENRVLSFDAAAGRETAQLMAQRRRAGKPVDLRDAMIAGIARATRGTLATRNSRHFEAS